jgi:PAS domain S-box-containing protein
MERWFSATKVPRYDEKGKIIGTIGITRDITERKQAEENVKNAKDELQIILDSAPAIIFYKNTEGKIIRANKALADLLRLPVRDIIGKTAEDIFSNEQAEKMRKDDREIIISGKPKRGIIQPHPTPDGLRFLISDKIPYRDKKGKITGVIVLAKDITVQRKSEQELQQTFQRLKKTMDAAIDTMSRIIEAKDPYTSGQPAPGLPISHPYCPRDETS